MPITSFLDGHKFDPETKRAMGVAFEMTRAALHLTDPDEIIAKKIIELAKAGERNPDLLCERALNDLRAPRPLSLSRNPAVEGNDVLVVER